MLLENRIFKNISSVFTVPDEGDRYRKAYCQDVWFLSGTARVIIILRPDLDWIIADIVTDQMDVDVTEASSTRVDHNAYRYVMFLAYDIV